MVHLPPKICPQCGEEYVHTVQRCVDCNVPLGLDAPEATPALDLPPSEQLVTLRNAEVSWIEGLAHALADAGIPSRVELPRREDQSVQSRGMGAIRCNLFVRQEDAEAAARVDAEFARTQVPDMPEDSESAFVDAEACPGCGAVLAADAIECAECGLSFGPG
jgi:ribosomal protein S27AE